METRAGASDGGWMWGWLNRPIRARSKAALAFQSPLIAIILFLRWKKAYRVWICSAILPSRGKHMDGKDTTSGDVVAPSHFQTTSHHHTHLVTLVFVIQSCLWITDLYAAYSSLPIVNVGVSFCQLQLLLTDIQLWGTGKLCKFSNKLVVP